jgi:hypothetical protein
VLVYNVPGGIVCGCGYDFDLTYHIGFRDLPPQIQRLYGTRKETLADE